MGEGKAYYYPRYLEKQYVSRVLAFWHKGRLITERGEVAVIDDFTDLVTTMFEENLLVFVGNLSDFCYLEQLVDTGVVFCDVRGKVLAAKVTGASRGTRWFVASQGWGHETPTLAFIQELRNFYDQLGTGTPSTPGAAGQASIRAHWKRHYGQEWYFYRHQRPPQSACNALRIATVGGRSDHLNADQHAVAFELDRKNAYGAAARKLPTGYTYRIISLEEHEEHAFCTFCATCTVTIQEPLVLGPFPVRPTDRTQDVCYPREPGTYHTQLWKEEVEAARMAGCHVTVGRGWGWREWTEELAGWLTWAEWFRDQAKSEQEKIWSKQLIVAALGRFNLPDEQYRLQKDGDPDNDSLFCTDRKALNFWIHRVIDQAPQSMPHWYAYIMMTCRLALYQKALPYAQAEQLIGTDTDAVYLRSQADISGYPEKKQVQISGEWGRITHTNYRMSDKRQHDSDQVHKHPGKMKDGTTRKRKIRLSHARHQRSRSTA